jgi:O-antigen/teichoic acid export membrane protein
MQAGKVVVVKSENRNAPAEMWRFLSQVSSGPLARAGLKSLALQIAAIVFGLVQAVILARLLGATDYGMFATAAAVSAILAAVAVGGFDQYAVRELSRLRVDGDLGSALAFIRFGNRWALAASVLGGGALAAVAAVYAVGDSGWRTTFMLAGAATPLATLLLLRDGQLRGLGAVVIAQVPIAVVRPGIMIVLLVAFWLAGLLMAAPLAMTAWLLACAASLVVASAALRPRTGAIDTSGPRPALTRKWLVDASPFFGSTVVVIIFSQVLTLMLAALAGPEAAGLYQPITYLAPVMALPVLALAKPFAPRIVELWRRGEQSTLRRITWMYTVATFAGTSAIGLAVLLFGSYGLSFFGPEFVAVTPALRWIVAATMIYAALGPSEILSSMMGAQHVVLGGSIFALTLTVALAALLIPTFGVDGATIAFAAGIVAGRLAMLIVTIRRFGFDSSLVGALRFAFTRLQ